jgi:hypothetical protein
MKATLINDVQRKLRLLEQKFILGEKYGIYRQDRNS